VHSNSVEPVGAGRAYLPDLHPIKQESITGQGGQIGGSLCVPSPWIGRGL